MFMSEDVCYSARSVYMYDGVVRMLAYYDAKANKDTRDQRAYKRMRVLFNLVNLWTSK